MYKRNPVGLQAAFRRRTTIIVGLIPFIILIGVYLVGSDIRLDANPADKLMPSLAAPPAPAGPVESLLVFNWLITGATIVVSA